MNTKTDNRKYVTRYIVIRLTVIYITKTEGMVKVKCELNIFSRKKGYFNLLCNLRNYIRNVTIYGLYKGVKSCNLSVPIKTITVSTEGKNKRTFLALLQFCCNRIGTIVTSELKLFI